MTRLTIVSALMTSLVAGTADFQQKASAYIAEPSARSSRRPLPTTSPGRTAQGEDQVVPPGQLIEKRGLLTGFAVRWACVVASLLANARPALVPHPVGPWQWAHVREEKGSGI
jgi:hypothetical protein